MSLVIGDHTGKAIGRLLEQYKERPSINALVTALVNPLQEIEGQLKSLTTDRWLDTAIGRQLNHLGEIVGEGRHFREDKEYRRAIFGKVLINNGGGTPEDIITAIDLVYKPKRIDYSELYPASFQVFVQGDNLLTGIKPLVRSVSPAGVGDIVITYLQDDAPFMCSSCGIENVPLSIVSNDNCSQIALKEEDNSKNNLEVAVDNIVLPENGLGFGGIIITESNLDIGDENVYMIDNNTPLALIASLDDFKVQDGGKLAGVIEHD